jgi:hypothetical protein
MLLLPHHAVVPAPLQARPCMDDVLCLPYVRGHMLRYKAHIESQALPAGVHIPLLTSPQPETIKALLAGCDTPGPLASSQQHGEHAQVARLKLDHNISLPESPQSLLAPVLSMDTAGTEGAFTAALQAAAMQPGSPPPLMAHDEGCRAQHEQQQGSQFEAATSGATAACKPPPVSIHCPQAAATAGPAAPTSPQAPASASQRAELLRKLPELLHQMQEIVQQPVPQQAQQEAGPEGVRAGEGGGGAWLGGVRRRRRAALHDCLDELNEYVQRLVVIEGLPVPSAGQ